MILFSACCICGLIGGILNFQFLRALTKKSSALYSLHLASMSLACIGIGGCTLSSWLTCRLASYEQRRMFSEREHSLHHSHEMAEKVSCVSSLIWFCFSWNVTVCVNVYSWQEMYSVFSFIWERPSGKWNAAIQCKLYYAALYGAIFRYCIFAVHPFQWSISIFNIIPLYSYSRA